MKNIIIFIIGILLLLFAVSYATRDVKSAANPESKVIANVMPSVERTAKK